MSWQNNDMRWTCPECRRFLPIDNGLFPFHGEIGFRCPMSEKPVASHLNTQAATTAETSNQQGKWDEKREHEKDLEHESRMDYESDQLAGNPPEQ